MNLKTDCANEYSLRNYGLAFMINTGIFIRKIKEGFLVYALLMLRAHGAAIFNIFTFLSTQGTFIQNDCNNNNKIVH